MKDQTIRKTISLGLAVLLACGGLNCFDLYAQAESGIAGTGLEEIREQAEVQRDPFAAEEGSTLSVKSESADGCYDLRDVDGKSYITPVRQQNPFGTCWGFGAIAAAESSILSGGLADDADQLNLSEKQLTWFVTQAINDEDDPQYGEGLNFYSSVSDKARYNMGGFTLYATNMFASGAGPVEEQKNTEDGLIFKYAGKAGKFISRSVTWFDESGNERSGVKPVYYDPDEDDWSIPDDYRFVQSYRLKESYMLPTPSVKEDGSDVKTYHPEATEAIKAQLLSNHAVCFSFRADHSQPGEETSEGGLMSDNWSQCDLDDTATANHAVTIVGFDDSYPKELFREDSQPEGDGAWLVKNSWGSDLNEFPDNGYSHWGLPEGQDKVGVQGKGEAVSENHTGYFWLSYYDKTIENPEAYSFEEYDGDCLIDQHDLMPVSKYQTYSTEAVTKTANVFQAEETVKVEDVSFLTATPGTTVSFKIYLLTADGESPEDGECVYESEPKTYAWGGYHKESVSSETDIIVACGQRYSVVAEQTTPAGKHSLSFGRTPEEDYKVCKFHAVVNKGESYLYIDEKWNDLYDEDIRNVLIGDAEGTEMDNFPIKAYVTPVDTGGSYLSVNGMDPYGELSESIKVGQQKGYEALFKGGTKDMLSDPDITWTSSDPDVVSVDTDGNNKYKAIITGLQDGTANLIADAGIYGKKIIKIKVNKLTLTGAVLDPDSKTMAYTGGSLEPNVIKVYVESLTEDRAETDKEGEDYLVSYKDNVTCGRAEVTVTGTGVYRGEETLNFIIVPRKAVIEKLTADKSSITMSFRSQSGSGVDGYELSCTDMSSGKVKTLVAGAEDTSAKFTGLDSSKKYSVAMKAYFTNTDTEPYFDTEIWDYVYPPEKYYGEESDPEIVTTGKAQSKTVLNKKLPVVKKVRLRSSGRNLIVKWKKLSYKQRKKTGGIELQFSRSKKFRSSSTVSKTLKDSKKALKIRDLKKGKCYYVRIRTYKNKNGTKYVSKWSAVKKIKIR